MHARLKKDVSARLSLYLLVALAYSSLPQFVHAANGEIYSNLSRGIAIDFMFNMLGAVFGGVAQLCFSLNNQDTFVKNLAVKAARNILLSVFVGFVIFIATEKGGFFEQDSGFRQLFFVTLGGAFASETMEKFREFWKSKFPVAKGGHDDKTHK